MYHADGLSTVHVANRARQASPGFCISLVLDVVSSQQNHIMLTGTLTRIRANAFVNRQSLLVSFLSATVSTSQTATCPPTSPPSSPSTNKSKPTSCRTSKPSPASRTNSNASSPNTTPRASPTRSLGAR